MRGGGRQRRFVAGAVGGWTALRLASCLGWGGAAIGTVAGMSAAPPRSPAVGGGAPWLAAAAPEPFRALPKFVPAARATGAGLLHLARAAFPDAVSYGGSGIVADRPPGSARSQVPGDPHVSARDLPPPVARPAPARRWGLSAYLFERAGHGSTLAGGGGALGGSQAAARLTYRLNDGPAVRTALAARVYAPLHAKGAEAAAGIDWYPLPKVALRLSAERRVALDHAGRNAWSAYAAGGAYLERHGWVLDGYGQAGVVGMHRRDLFVDGAIRAGRKIALGAPALVLGAGLWGAAQPGAERIDVGPRAALTLPVAGHAVTAALEGRFRAAGRASPGSGAALTVGVDF